MKKKENIEENIEELAAKAKLAREEKCSVEVRRILEEHKCQIGVFVQVGEQVLPLGQVLSLPLVVLVKSKG